MSNTSDFVIEKGVLEIYRGNETVVEIPDSVTKIGTRAFLWSDVTSQACNIDTMYQYCTPQYLCGFLRVAGSTRAEYKHKIALFPEKSRFLANRAFSFLGICGRFKSFSGRFAGICGRFEDLFGRFI